MSQSDTMERNNTYSLPIDTEGEIARFKVAGGSSVATVSVNVDADAIASYSIEFGVEDADDENLIHWFIIPGDYRYNDTNGFADSWEQVQKYFRVMIDSPATAGTEARVAISYGAKR